MDIDAARSFIAAVRWQFAKTMPQWPHEYTVREWQPDDGPFVAFVLYIREHGYPGVFKGKPRTYCAIDGWTYWTMGAPLGQTIIINRARVVM